jgi:hypothetical protein
VQEVRVNVTGQLAEAELALLQDADVSLAVVSDQSMTIQ